MADPLLVLGRTEDPAVESARRAGYDPVLVALDDPSISPLERLRDIPVEIPLLLSVGAEARLDVAEAAAFERKTLSCSIDSIRQVRSLQALATLPSYRGLKIPKMHLRVPIGRRLARLLAGWLGATSYLLKPLHGCGGDHISTWWPTQRIPDGFYIQQRIAGSPISAAYHADGWSCALLGVTRQIVGEPALGCREFQHGGNLGPIDLAETQRAALAHLGVVLTQRHDLRGLFGIDLILDRKGAVWPIEVNPRFTDGMALLEQAAGQSLLHAPRPVKYRGITYGRAVVRDHRGHITTTRTASAPDPQTCLRALIEPAEPLSHPRDRDTA